MHQQPYGFCVFGIDSMFPAVWLFFLDFSSDAPNMGESRSMLTECCLCLDAVVRVVIVVDKVDAIQLFREALEL